MLRTAKPKTARSKRALQKKEAKVIENVKTALFVKGTQTSNNLNIALKELAQLKKPDAINFSRRNDVHPFEDATSFDFWSEKNDAAFLVFGRHMKKRPHSLVLARMFDHQVLDMLELGVEEAKSMSEFKTPKASVGTRPLFVFSGDLFETHPIYVQLKSLLLDLYHGEIADSVNLAGLGHVISVTVGSIESSPTPAASTPALIPAESTSTPLIPGDASSNDAATLLTHLPLVHLRTYTVQLLKSGQREPRVALTEMGPSLDLRPGRSRPANEEVWKKATTLKLAVPKPKAGKAKKGNLDFDEMGNRVGRIHVGKQDLSKLQSRKMRGLKRRPGEDDDADATAAATGDNDDDGGDAMMDEDDGVGEIMMEKRQKRV